MFRYRVAPVLALLFVLFFAQTAQAFFDPPWVTPAAPMAGETVSVNIRGGVCDAIFGRDGYPNITQTGNAIRILEYGHHYEPGDELCVYGVGTVTDPIGVFPPGDYTLTVEMAYLDGFGISSLLRIGVVPFTVAAPSAPVAAVPATAPFALAVLMVLLAGGVWAMRNRGSSAVFFIALACLPLGAQAQKAAGHRTIQVLLTNAPGAPTLAQVVSWVNASPRTGAR